MSKKRGHPESQLQKSCVKWFRLQYPRRILMAIPNGGKRGVIEASIMKAEGVLAGTPDLFLAASQWNDNLMVCPGLFIEMKIPGTYPTPTQKEMHASLGRAGYAVEVCRTFEEFKDAVNEYLR